MSGRNVRACLVFACVLVAAALPVGAATARHAPARSRPAAHQSTPRPQATAAPSPSPSPVAVATEAPAGAAPQRPLREVAQVSVPGRPFGAVFSSDGSTLFVSVDLERRGGVAILSAASGRFTLTRFVALEGTPGGLALTPDGATLIATTGTGLALFDARALAAGNDSAPRYVADPGGSIEVTTSRDGRYAFYTNENAGTLGIADLAGARVTGHVALDAGPVGVTLTHDGRRLFITSALGSAAATSRTCRGTTGALVREGTLTEIDAAAAIANPDRVRRVTVGAGCGPSRVVLSPHDDVAWVSTRDDNAIAGFDAAHFDPKANEVPFVVPVGNAPVGLAYIGAAGTLLAVANSDRYAIDGTQSTLTIVDTAAAFAGRHSSFEPVPTGGFPRELVLTHDGAMLALTNYRTNSVQIFAVAAR